MAAYTGSIQGRNVLTVRTGQRLPGRSDAGQMGTQTNAVILPGYQGSFLCTVQLQEEMESEARRPHWWRALTPLCARDVYVRINDEDKAQYGHWCVIPPPPPTKPGH